MEPANLIIDPSLDAFQQTKLAKRHADAIVSAWTGYDCEDKTLGCICYCTSASDVAECERECVDLVISLIFFLTKTANERDG